MTSHQEGGWPRIHISRPRLLSMLSEATHFRVTLVCAGPGYGKSTLLQEYLQMAGVPSALYRLSPSDRDPARLASGLAACLAQMTGRRIERPNPRGTGASVLGVLCQGLLRHMLKPQGGLGLLVLDDYDRVDNAVSARSLLQMLIEQSPDFLHFVILSRSVPSLRLGRLRAQQQLFEVGQADLMFRLEETVQVLRHVASEELTDDQITLMHQRMEGWAAGIAAACQSLRHGRREQLLRLLADQAGPARLVYDYLAQEVFDCQDESAQDFLMKTSILAKMSFEACDWLLERDDSLQVLRELERGGLFTTAIDPEGLTFRYHQLFQEFLRGRLQERLRRDEIRTLHRRAAFFYESQRDWEACVHHLLKAGETAHAADVVESVGEMLILSGLSQTVAFWLAALPSELVGERPWLLALRGRLAQMAVMHEDARRLLERALLLFQAASDDHGQAWATGELGYVEYRSGFLAESLRRFEEALSKARPGSLLESQLLVMQASAYRLAGMLDQSIQSCKASLRALAAVDDETFRNWGQSRATRNLALALMERGDLDSAHTAAAHALSLCSEWRLGEYEEGWALATLGAVLWAEGDLQAAVQALEQAWSLSGHHVRHLQHFICLWWGSSLANAGRLEEAAKILEMSPGTAELERVFVHVLAGCARQVRWTAEALYQQHRDSENLTDMATAEVVFSAVQRASGEPLRALAHATRGVELLRSGGHCQRLASALLHKARLEYECSRRDLARASLGEAFKLAGSNGYVQFYWWDREMVAFLCAQALTDGLAPDYVRQLLIHRRDVSRAAVLLPLLQSHQVQVRHLAMSMLRSLSDGTDPVGEILCSCPDPDILQRLMKAAEDRVVSLVGLRSLQENRGLTWREVDVLVEYYLRPATDDAISDVRWRNCCASQMGLSEHTLRCHINSLRRKLAIRSFGTRKDLLEWAAGKGILPTPDPPSQPTAGSSYFPGSAGIPHRAITARFSPQITPSRFLRGRG